MKTFITLICVLLLAGCEARVYPIHWQHAIEMCEKNGGIDFVSIDEARYDVHCTNGAAFLNVKKYNGLGVAH